LAFRGSTIKSHERPREYRTICKEQERTSHLLLKENQTVLTLAVIVVVILQMTVTENDVVVHPNRLVIPTDDEKGENPIER
jgi:hypothetical protein